MTPLISVMLPTRRRTGLLPQSLGSLMDRARDTTSIELAVIHDDDDTETRDWFQGPQWHELQQRWQNPWICRQVPRLGYSRLNEYLNILAPQCHGQWLLFWNDDAVMETPHWDDHVRANRDWPGLLHMPCRNVPMRCSIFPLFNRRWLDVFGMVSPNTFSDSWISDVARGAGVRREIPVWTFHDRFEETGHNQDETWSQRSYSNRRDYHSEANRALRQQWSQRLRTAITDPA